MSVRKSYDVIVVGAGPAGAVSAYRLATFGLRVLILEKEMLPRYKACGGGLTLKTINEIPFDISPVYERKAVGGILSYAGRPLSKFELSKPVACLVMRDRFDYFIVERAAAAGAELIDGVTVSKVEQETKAVVVYSSAGTFKSSLLVGADGVNSRVAKSVGLLKTRQTGVAIEAEVGVPATALDIQGAYATFDFGALPGGYAWIFPKHDHLSVGVFQASSNKAIHLQEYLEQFIASHSVLREHRKLRLVGHRIPLGGGAEQLHAGRVLLIGDAANLADPWLGEGIHYAVASANEAVDVMKDYLNGAVKDLSAYTRRINSSLMLQFIEAKRYARVVYRFPSFSLALFHRSPFVIESIFSLLRGDVDFKQLTRRLLRGSPRIILDVLRG